MIKIIILLILSLATEAFAFNAQRCRDGEPSKDGTTPVLERNFLVDITGTFVSSTEYVSSTGNCAAIGSVEEKRELFYVYNSKFIQADIARGGGEYSDVMLSFFNCSENQKQRIVTILKNNFETYLDNLKLKLFSLSRACSAPLG